MSGRVRRSTTTATLTRREGEERADAGGVGELRRAGRAAASTPQNSETITVLARGAPVFGSTLAKTLGTRPSRDIAKRMRVWP